MAKKSISSRIKITKSGKITRRAMSLGHSKGNKRKTQINRKKKIRGLAMTKKTINRYLS
ncbi:MAG: hypothetical protein AAB935_01850 [Patescibacteria group bacterium]